MLPRQFLVKAVLQGIRRNPGLPPDILASRIADTIEAAADIFESNDDAMPVSDYARSALALPPQSPEDINTERNTSPEKPLLNLPQPPPTRTAIILPGSEEARETMSNVGHVRAIRPQRTGHPSSDHERQNWDFNQLYATLMSSMPMSIRLIPEGQKEEIEVDRSFQANAATGIVKVVYSPPVNQRASSPTAPNPDGQTIDTPMSIPVDVSKSFSTFDPVSIDFDREVYNLKETARKSFRVRSRGIPSVTPMIPNRTLDHVFAEAVRNNSVPADTPVRSAFTGTFETV